MFKQFEMTANGAAWVEDAETNGRRPGESARAAEIRQLAGEIALRTIPDAMYYAEPTSSEITVRGASSLEPFTAQGELVSLSAEYSVAPVKLEAPAEM